jgi:hypothetical protein
MRIQANKLQQGDKIMGLGPAAEVHVYGQQQAVTGPTKMPWPTDRDGHTVKGAMMHAALARMAVGDCYQWVATIVQVKIGRAWKFFAPTDMVEIVGEAQVLAEAA